MQPYLRSSTRQLIAALTIAGAVCAGDPVTSQPFHGVKVNTGTVTLSQDGCKRILTLSADFVVPDTPAPHWQIVDSAGHAHLLQRLKVKGDKVNSQVTLPDHIADIAKVQIWCAFAETLLGEADFGKTVGGSRSPSHTSRPFAGPKANKGHVSHYRDGASSYLTLSDDFVIPDTPAPHWQVVDSNGRVHLLQRLMVKEGKFNRTIVLPSYVADVARVQIWCAYAETLLGEALFTTPVM